MSVSYIDMAQPKRISRLLKVILVGLLLYTAFCLAYVLAEKKQSEPSPVTPMVAKSEPKPASLPNADELFALTNAERVKVGVRPLERNPLLDKSAQLKADEMERTGVFEHVGTTGKHGYTYIDDVGVRCIYRSENLAGEANKYNSTQTIVTWLNSNKGHKEAMLGVRYEQVGFGVSKTYIVAHYCDVL